jgi:two-component system chemotaxis response regulator CheY
MFNILVVDDSAVMRAMVIRTLKLSYLALGEIHEAANGELALAAIRAHWIDLVLADLNMPVMGGEEMMARMKADEATRDVRVIVVSSESGAEKIREIERKAAGFIHKPFTPEAIRAKIMEVMGVDEDGSAGTSALSDDSLDF